MHVLHISNRILENGTGITNMLSDLALGQSESGLKVSVATPDIDSSLVRHLESHGVAPVRIPKLSSMPALLQAANILRLKDRDDRFDVFHVHTVKALLISILAGPSIYRRTVSTLHNVHQRSSMILLAARIPVAVSDSYRSQIRKKSKFVAKRMRVVVNGTVGSSRTLPVSSVVPAPMESPALLYVGGLKERKGVDLLLKYFNEVSLRVPQAHLYLLGNRDNAEIEEQAKQSHNCERIHFVGFVKDPRSYMLGASALIVPSRREAFGLVVTDARSCSTPVIASDVDGLPEALSGGSAGVLLDPYDADAWVDAMTRILVDEEWRRDQQTRSQAGVERFTVSRMVAGYVQVYEELLS